ncbi:hypothetical protein CDEF62S_06331 [Castellaniella defragrans]
MPGVISHKAEAQPLAGGGLASPVFQQLLLTRVRGAADKVFKENPDQFKVYELLTRVADKYKQ